MRIQKFFNRSAFEQYHTHEQFAHHQAFEQNLIKQHAKEDVFKFSGVCKACDKHAMFLVDKKFGGVETGQTWLPNWRERLVCQCELNNRQRAILHSIKDSVFARQEISTQPLALYATEQITPVFQWLTKHLTTVRCVGSEYLGENIAGGTVQKNIQHENIENLSFAAQRFDLVMSNDVLEHVNQPDKALQEIYRILKPDGELFLSIPFNLNAEQSVRRAAVHDGKLVHYLEAVYHGNPLSEEGSLVFHDFGWDFLDLIRNTGFKEVCLCHYWSKLYGYLGEPQYYIWACKT